jgi:methyl-accepting chemotaxis protein
MRLTLRTQITTALVLFGLVPAAIVATFAWVSSEDYKDKQKTLIKQAAQHINNSLGPQFFRKFEEGKNPKPNPLEWIPDGPDREAI